MARCFASLVFGAGLLGGLLSLPGCIDNAPADPPAGNEHSERSPGSEPATPARPDIMLIEPFQADKTFALKLAAGIAMEFIRIPPGTFRMGDGKLGNRVTITKAFFLGRYEVTQQQWETVMGNNPSRLKIGPNYPVERINWDDCTEFLKKMNERYADCGMRFALPSEAQWEYAARGGNQVRALTNEDPDCIHAYGWIGSNSDNEPHPVGQKRPNAWGLYDMQGNLAEWCADPVPAGDPPSATGDSAASVAEFHAVRGGCFHDGESSCLPTSRVLRRSFVPLRFDGLRLMCTPK